MLPAPWIVGEGGWSRSGQPTGRACPTRSPTPRLKTPGDKGARKEWKDEDERRKEQRDGGEASSPPEKTLSSLSLSLSLSLFSMFKPSPPLGTGIAKGVHPGGVRFDIFPPRCSLPPLNCFGRKPRKEKLERRKTFSLIFLDKNLDKEIHGCLLNK